MRPFSKGWEKLTLLERLEIWFEINGPRLRGGIRVYKTLMRNFGSSCKEPIAGDYLNFLNDIRNYPEEHQRVLSEGFFSMYNIPPVRSIGPLDPSRN